jgi:hypothetical protein
MSVKGQTHAKRAREFALKEKRERKKAKQDARRNGVVFPEGEGEGEGGEPTVEPQPESPQPEAGAEWVQ